MRGWPLSEFAFHRAVYDRPRILNFFFNFLVSDLILPQLFQYLSPGELVQISFVSSDGLTDNNS